MRFCSHSDDRGHPLSFPSETIASAIRLVQLIRLDLSDVTWNYLPALVWTTVELCVGIICASLPAMAPLVSVCLRQRSSSREPNIPSSFELSETPKRTNDFVRRNFDRLEDDSVDLVPGMIPPMEIWHTTDTDVSQENTKVSKVRT